MAPRSFRGPKLGPFGRLSLILLVASAVAFVVAPLWVGVLFLAASVFLSSWKGGK